MLDLYFFLFYNWFDFLFLNNSLLNNFLLFSLNFLLFSLFFALFRFTLFLSRGTIIIIRAGLWFFLIWVFMIRNNKVFLFRSRLMIIDHIRINASDFFSNPPELSSFIWILNKHQFRLIILLLFLLLLFFPLQFLFFSLLTSFSFFLFTFLSLLQSLFLFLFTSFLLFRVDRKFVWYSSWGYYVLNYHLKILLLLNLMTLTLCEFLIRTK